MANNKTIFVVQGDEALLGNEHNKRFVVSAGEPVLEDDDGTSQNPQSFYGDHGTPAPVWATPVVLCITTDHLPEDTSVGFTIGRNSSNCDILLSDSRISDRHLAVGFNLGSGEVLLKNHSQHGTRVRFSDHKILLKSERALVNCQTAYVEFDNNLRIQIHRYDNPVDWKQYIATYASYDLPGIALLGLNTNIKTTNASNRQPVYIKGRRLGEGAYGEVFQAVEQYTADVYAMKVFKPGHERWKEHAMLASLKHDHVVRYIAYNHVAGQPAQLIMEFVDGPNLHEFLNPSNGHAPLEMLEIQLVLRQLLQAVAYLHGEGVTHRDIKPANIILVQRSPVHTKLVDFGLATDVDKFNTFCGSPLYVAPEIVRKLGPCTNKVDLFSVGVVMLKLFGVDFKVRRRHGARRRGAKPYLDAVLKQRQLLAAQASSLPAHLDLGVQLLADHPDDRPSAQECLGHFFFTAGALADTGVAAGAIPNQWPVSDPVTQIFHANPDAEDEAEAMPDEIATEQMDSHDYDRFYHAGVHPASAQQGSQHRTRHATGRSHSASRASSSRTRPKRHKNSQSHSSVLSSTRPAFVRSFAPSPLSPSGDRSNHTWASDPHGYRAEAGQGQLDSGHSPAFPETNNSVPPTTEILDTASCASAFDPWPLAVSHDEPQVHAQDSSFSRSPTAESPSEKSIYEDCWLDPSHALGAGSSLSGHHRATNTARGAAPQPASDATPSFHSFHSFHSFSRLGDLGDQVVHSPGKDGATSGPLVAYPEGDLGAAEVAALLETDGRISVGDPDQIRFPYDSAALQYISTEYITPTEEIVPHSTLRQGNSDNDNEDDEDDEDDEEDGDDENDEENVDGAALYDASVPTALVINGCEIATDDQNGYISINDIYKAGKVDGITRLRSIHRLDTHGAIFRQDEVLWVPIQDGCFLCAALGIDPSPIFNKYGLDPEVLRGNYILLRKAISSQYNVLWWDDTAIFYEPETCLVNLTSLAKVYGISRGQVSTYCQKQHVVRTIARGVYSQGQYVALEVCYQFCAANGADAAPVHVIAAWCGL